MPESPNQHDRNLFDEDGYLRLYRDVADAVAAGTMRSAREHYDRHGRAEGRRSNDVDAAFYLRAYPQISDDLGRAPIPADAAAHYIGLGRGRGYLPKPGAPRSVARCGLWTDRADAEELIRERLATNQLKHRPSVLLRNWMTNGYVTIDDLEHDILAAAALDLERAFAGAWPSLLFDCPGLADHPICWQADLPPCPADALDLHFLSGPIRNLLLSQPIAGFLAALFDAPVLLTHSRTCLRDAGCDDHRDSAIARFTLPHQFVAVWIGLEGVMDTTQPSAEAASVFVRPGSHRPGPTGERRALAAHDGTAVIRHGDLLHGAAPIDEAMTRRGVTAWLCPRHVAPLYAEQVPTRLYRRDTHRFTTGFYAGLEPSG
ncbi:MAG TPA: hypothetical protein VIG49_08905 [Acetobacteraceae bacterium]